MKTGYKAFKKGMVCRDYDYSVSDEQWANEKLDLASKALEKAEKKLKKVQEKI